MFRVVVLHLAVVSAVLVFSNVGLAQLGQLNRGQDFPTVMKTSLKLGELFKGEFGVKEKRQVWVTGRISRDGEGITPDINMYAAAFPITLKAGQELTVAVTVTGQDRLVGAFVLDPQNKRIQAEEKEKSAFDFGGTQVVLLSRKADKITIEEIPASGKHTIIVVSNRVGAFTVQATSGAGEDREALEKELKELRRRVSEIEAKLKALDGKEKK